MKRLSVLLADHARRVVKLTVLIFAFAQMALAAPTTLFVATNLNGDGSSWANATNSIQGAISAIDPSDPTNTVWVSNGVYEVGGVTNYPSGAILTNRVAITNAITVRSANNDSTNTIIKGAWGASDTSDPRTNGPTAVRCVYMINGASLIGFTLSNGATLKTAVAGEINGGGVYCQSTNTVISNCVLVYNAAYAGGGGAYYGTLYNCTVNSNKTGGNGGGTRYSTLYDCMLSNNYSGANGYTTEWDGGGAYYCTLYNCTIVGNWAQSFGGGAYGSTLYNCTLTNNYAPYGNGAGTGCILSNCTLVNNNWGVSAAWGCTLFNCMIVSNSSGSDAGGARSCTLSNCTLIGNSATTSDGRGGGAFLSTLYNCLLIGNSAKYGGGTHRSTLYNCTIANNSASTSGGGVYSNSLINCIVYFNTAPVGSNWQDVISFTNSCTAPAAGSGNITDNPMFIDTNTVNYRLSANSPCINTGTNINWMTNSYDRDGRTRIRYGTVDMGAYEKIYEGTIYRIP